jgi:hypothetical protein
MRNTNAGKIMFLDSDQIWIIGNIPDLHLFHRIYAYVLQSPAPLLTTFANILHPNLPTTLEEWKHAQQNTPDFLQSLDPDSLASINGLTVFKSPDFPSRILVPPTYQTQLIRQHHADLQHVSHPKVFTSLARHYHWPTMKADVRRVCEDCEFCENEKGKRKRVRKPKSVQDVNRGSVDFQEIVFRKGKKKRKEEKERKRKETKGKEQKKKGIAFPARWMQRSRYINQSISFISAFLRS